MSSRTLLYLSPVTWLPTNLKVWPRTLPQSKLIRALLLVVLGAVSLVRGVFVRCPLTLLVVLGGNRNSAVTVFRSPCAEMSKSL